MDIFLFPIKGTKREHYNQGKFMSDPEYCVQVNRTTDSPAVVSAVHSDISMAQKSFDEDFDFPDTESYFSKNLIVPGSGFYSPVDGATCSLSLECLKPANSNISVGYPLGDKVQIKIGEGDCEISENIDKCLIGMKKGETSQVSIYIFQESETVPTQNLSENNYIEYVFRIKLNSFHNPCDCYKMSNDEKLDIAKWHKSKGVELFKSGEIKFAFRRFSKALRYLIICNSKKDIPGNYSEIKCQCYLNLAACQLKYESYDFVISNCSKALRINSKAIKGLVRRGQAYLGKDNLQSALSDFKKALKIEPNNKFVRQLMHEVKNRKINDNTGILKDKSEEESRV